MAGDKTYITDNENKLHRATRTKSVSPSSIVWSSNPNDYTVQVLVDGKWHRAILTYDVKDATFFDNINIDKALVTGGDGKTHTALIVSPEASEVIMSPIPTDEHSIIEGTTTGETVINTYSENWANVIWQDNVNVYKVLVEGSDGKKHTALLTTKSGGGAIEVIVRGTSPLSLPDAIANSLEYLKAFGGTEQRNLPAEYTQVNYVTNTAQTMIDTGVKFDFSKNYEIELRVRGVIDSWYILQARESSSAMISGISGSSFGDRISLSFKGSNVVASQISRVDGHIYYLKGTINNGNLTLYVKDETAGTEETVTGTYTVATGQSVNVGLFGNIAGNYVGINSDVYFARIKEDGVAVMDYVPCRQVATAGFYDKASGTFKTATKLVADGNTVPTPDTPMDIVSNNGVLKVRHQSGLPLGYTLLDYIESTGTQYIDTGYVPNVDTEIKINFSTTTLPSSDAYIFHSTDGRNARVSLAITQHLVFFGNDLNNLSNRVNIPDFTANTAYDITVNKDKTIVNGTEYTFTHTGVTLPTMDSMGLFGTRTGNLKCQGRVKSFSCYENNVLKINLIPAKRNSDNVLGMFDLVSGQFFTNAGTGTFTAGNPASDPVEVYADGTVETINVHGKNLFNELTRTDDKYIGNDGSLQVGYGWCTSDYIPVKAGTYTCSFINNFKDYYKRCAFFDINKNFVSILAAFDGRAVSGQQSYTITVPSDGYVRFALGMSDANVQFELGSTATEYEEYFNGGTATAEMLLKVGDYEDVQEILSGTATRRVGVKVFDGTEDWTASPAGNFYNTVNDIKASVSDVGTILCTHLKQGIKNAPLTNEISFRLNYNGFIINSDTATTVSEWTTYLTSQYNAGTPVIVIYPLATPTTESVAGQAMQVQQGDNVVEITQASLDNLELEAKYQAAVSLTIQEVQDANLDPNVQVTIN